MTNERTEVQITEADLSAMLQQKVNAVTNLELQATVLQRVIQEKDALIDQLSERLAEKEPSSSSKESTNAKGRKEEVPVL